LNPEHPDFGLITLAEPIPFEFDPRMWEPRKLKPPEGSAAASQATRSLLPAVLDTIAMIRAQFPDPRFGSRATHRRPA